MKQFSKKGFTLVEIMIVVVIIGLLAALAIPAFKKVRNTATEKTILNDARQISSAFNQYCTENSVTNITLKSLIGPGKYVASLSSGTLIKSGVQAGVLTAADKWVATDAFNDTIVLATSSDAALSANAIVALGNLGYDTSLSSNAKLAVGGAGGYAANDNALNFSVETGALLKKGAAVATITTDAL